MEKDIVAPLFFFAIVCCKLVSIAIVSLFFAKGAVNENRQLSVSVGCPEPLEIGYSLNACKFAALIPVPSKSAITSSRLVSRPAPTERILQALRINLLTPRKTLR